MHPCYGLRFRFGRRAGGRHELVLLLLVLVGPAQGAAPPLRLAVKALRLSPQLRDEIFILRQQKKIIIINLI